MEKFINVGSFVLGAIAYALFLALLESVLASASTSSKEALNKYMDASQKDCYTRKEIEIIQQDN